MNLRPRCDPPNRIDPWRPGALRLETDTCRGQSFSIDGCIGQGRQTYTNVIATLAFLPKSDEQSTSARICFLITTWYPNPSLSNNRLRHTLSAQYGSAWIFWGRYKCCVARRDQSQSQRAL